MYILSQVLVGLADVLYVGSMLQKKKISLVILLLVSDILFASHYLCLGAITGGIIIYIDAIFLLVTYLLEKFNKQKFTTLTVIITMILTIITTVFTWGGIVSLLPMFSMLAYLFGMIFKNIVFVKIGSFVRNLLNIVYMIIIASFIGAGLEFCLMLSAIIGIVINLKNKKKEV